VPLDLPGGGELDPVIDLIEGAGGLLLECQKSSLSIEKKGFRDLVTDADLRSERYVVAGLNRLYPEVAILAEEAGGELPSSGRCWIVDPLDGTTNYSHGHPLFSVSAALVDDEGPVACVTHSPILAETWWAIRNRGAWKCRGTVLQGEQLTLKSTAPLGDCLLATGFSYQRKELDHGALDVFESLLRRAREIRRGGSACLDLAFTAEGIFQGFWEFYLQPHDVAAGALLIREAGGVVTDGVGGDDWLLGGSIVAATAELHPVLLEVVRPAVPPTEGDR
jgi:myo-inositol-1(or 4)-monophosphatase